MTAEFHPQRDEIIRMFADTERKWTLEQIASKINPPLAISTLSRFKRKVIGSLASTITVKSAKAQTYKDIGLAATNNLYSDDAAHSAKLLLQAKVNKTQSRIENWLSEVENKPFAHEDGHERMDHKALASHAKNLFTSYELEGKLTGALLEAPTTNVQVAVLMPGAVQEAPATAQVIDITKTR